MGSILCLWRWNALVFPYKHVYNILEILRVAWNTRFQGVSLYFCPRGCLHSSPDDENLHPITNGSDSYVKCLFSCHIGSVDKNNFIHCHGGGIKNVENQEKSWESTGNYLIWFSKKNHEKKIKNKKVRAILEKLKKKKFLQLSACVRPPSLSECPT